MLTIPRKDNIPGVYPRWHISFNITMLRLVSFNLDYYWACKHPSLDDVRFHTGSLEPALMRPTGALHIDGQAAQDDSTLS